MTRHPFGNSLFLGPLCIAVALISACGGLATTPAPTAAQPVVEPAVSAPAPVTPDPNPALERRIGELERRIAGLELKLLEKEQQVQELQARLDDARREVVRAMGRQQSLATRAEAASSMAEAEVALQALPQTVNAQQAAEARVLMELSTAEFGDQNYGGALYLANQAKSAAAIARQQLGGPERGSPRPGETPFVVPLQLQTTTASNVRGGPGLDFGVLFVLPADAPLTGYSSVQQWLSVADDTGRRGWIWQDLIRQRP
jgi:hypothetical protein